MVGRIEKAAGDAHEMDNGPAMPGQPALPSPPKTRPPTTRSSKIWPLKERPGFLMRRLHQIHVSLFAERCGGFRITPLQYSLLSLLMELGDVDQTTLANAAALDRTTTTGALKRLEARGLIDRSASPHDRRSQRCRLTDEGHALLTNIEEVARLAHEATLSALSFNEKFVFIELMKKIADRHDQTANTLDINE